MRSHHAHLTVALIGALVVVALDDTPALAWGPSLVAPAPPPAATAAPAREAPPPPPPPTAAAPATAPAAAATAAPPPTVRAPASPPPPAAPSAPSPRVFGIQVAPGLKYLPRDPVAAAMSGYNPGSPQTLELGLNLSLIILPPGWPVSLTVSASYASQTQEIGVTETTSTSELGVGVRKTFVRGPLRSFVGGGLAMGGIQIKDDAGAQGYRTWVGGGSGAFLEAGAAWRIREIVDAGLIARVSNFWSRFYPVGEANYWDTGGAFVGLLVGYGP